VRHLALASGLGGMAGGQALDLEAERSDKPLTMDEILEMQAMKTGHEGSMTTLHSNSARDAIYRLESMLAMGGVDMPIRVLRDYVASAIDMVVHLMRLPDGRRVIGEVLEVGEAGDEGLRMQPSHRYRVTGGHEGRTDGFFESTGVRPAFLEYLESRGIRIDPRAFAAGKLDEGAAT
jgi:pilus assembly protein CpaF